MNQQQVIEILQCAGYVPSGQTLSQTFKVVTANSYPLTGAIMTTGGRPRFELPGTNKRATVGKRTVCLYEVVDRQTTNFRNIKTAEFNAESLEDSHRDPSS